MTLDSQFMTFYELKDEEHGVKISVPDTWKYMDKNAYEKSNVSLNTSFFLLTSNNGTVNIVCDGKCKNEQLDEAINVNIENMKKSGTIIEKQYSTEGEIKSRQLFVKVKQNDKEIRLFQVYRIVNDYLFCASWQITNENIELDQLLTNVCNSFAMGVINSLRPIAGNTTNKKDEDFTIKNINEEYSNNKITEKLIKMLHIFSDSTIKSDDQDPFWSDTAKNVLEMIVLISLINNNNVSKENLIEQVKDTNKIKITLKDNIGKLSIPELNGIMSSKLIIDSAKPFESVMEIIQKALIPNIISTEHNEKTPPAKPKLNNQTADNLKEYSQEIPNYPTFKFYFPESMGEYSKTTSNVFELKKDNIQKIRVMISKCSSAEILEEEAKKWIEKNKTDAKMEDVSYRKEMINNIPIEVYELRKIGSKGTRIYKIGYVNGCRITISGGNIEGKEEIINKAFENITWEDKKENFFNKLENTLKTTYIAYQENNLDLIIKEFDSILDELFKDDSEIQQNMILKMYIYDIFKVIILNNYYNKNQVSGAYLDSLIANKKDVVKNIEEFFINFKEEKDVISKLENINDNMLKSISDKMIEDVLHRIMINLGKKNISKITTKATEEKHENKKVENKPITVDCPACNTNFELKWNVPATEKTFYCKCPNCGMELKRANPNYKDKEEKNIANNKKDKIITYLINVLKQTEKRAATSFDKLNQYEDIVNEFANCINGEEFIYCENGIVVEGYSAKELKNKVGDKLSDLGVYNYLIYLRENPEEAMKYLKAGLPRY